MQSCIFLASNNKASWKVALLGNQFNLVINFPSLWQLLGKFFRQKVPIIKKKTYSIQGGKLTASIEFSTPLIRATKKVGVLS